MRTPLLILLMLAAVIGGLAFGALLGVIVIGLILGLVGAAIIALAGWGAVRSIRHNARHIGADRRRELDGPRA